MSIFTKLKTATDFSASVIKEGFALIWPEKKSDGSVALQVKLEDGSVQEIGGGSAGDIDAAVHIYDATVESSTGVVTITDGTPVSDLAIGDEIRTPDGVYQKVKDSITTTGTADGTRIEVSGITNPAGANGVYILQSENVWKHETENYWITVFFSASYYWMISNKSDPANPSESLFYAFTAPSQPRNPWDLTNWESVPISSGTPVLENVEASTTITNTIDLFEYATFPEDGAKTSDITDDIATHNANTSAHPDKLPLSGGQMTGELKINASNALRLNNKDGYGVILRKDANKFYILATAQNDENGAYTESRPLEVNLATGGCDISGSALETESNLSSTGVYPSVSPNTTATADFNTFKTQGNYWFAFGVRPNGPLGDTAETTGMLSVYNIQNTHMLQVYNMYSGTGVSTQQMYYRWCYNNTWTSWARVTTAESMGTTTNDYNSLTEPGDYYLSFGDNSSNLNAPGNGPFHVMVHRYQNSAGTAKPILQIAASQIVSTAQTPMMFFRSASYADSAWTFQPWLKLLTEKDVTYNTGPTGVTVTKNDYIKIGNVIVYIGSVNLMLNTGTGFALPVLSNHMTFVASCNTYGVTITKLDIFLDSSNNLNVDIGGTRSEAATDDQVDVGWIGIGYLN